MIFNLLKSFFQTAISNLWLKLISVFIAVVIWSMVQGEEIVESNRRVKVNISVGRGYGVKGPTFRYIEAKLRAPRYLLSEVEARSLEANLFIPSGQTGEIESPFDRSWIVGLDPRIKLTVRETHVSVFVDELSEKTVQVRDTMRGAPMKGFFVQDVTIVPEFVKISGLKAELALTKEVFTEAVDISGLAKKESSFLVNVLPGDGLDIIPLPEQVTVKVRLADTRINRSFSDLALSVIGLQSGFQVMRKKVKISLQGTKESLNAIEGKDLQVFVDLSNAKAGLSNYDVRVKIPPDTVLVGVEPSQVQVKVDKSEVSPDTGVKP